MAVGFEASRRLRSTGEADGVATPLPHSQAVACSAVVPTPEPDPPTITLIAWLLIALPNPNKPPPRLRAEGGPNGRRWYAWPTVWPVGLMASARVWVNACVAPVSPPVARMPVLRLVGALPTMPVIV